MGGYEYKNRVLITAHVRASMHISGPVHTLLGCYLAKMDNFLRAAIYHEFFFRKGIGWAKHKWV